MGWAVVEKAVCPKSADTLTGSTPEKMSTQVGYYRHQCDKYLAVELESFK